MSHDAPPSGHVKLARKAFSAEYGDPFWLEAREFSRFEAWVDVIQLAAWKPGRYTTAHFGTVELQRGEFVASLRWLANRWGWTVKRVRTWLATCEKWARLKAQHEAQAGTVYLLVNYDAYQNVGHTKGTPEGTGAGTAGAQQGHKIEAVKAVQAVTTSRDEEAEQVMQHYLATHPSRRRSRTGMAAVRRALKDGYTVEQLCEAIEGNAGDKWHADTGKQELSYVLRNSELIDSFIARRAASAPKLAVDPITRLPNAIGLGVISGGRK